MRLRPRDWARACKRDVVASIRLTGALRNSVVDLVGSAGSIVIGGELRDSEVNADALRAIVARGDTVNTNMSIGEIRVARFGAMDVDNDGLPFGVNVESFRQIQYQSPNLDHVRLRSRDLDPGDTFVDDDLRITRVV